jgi:hypothetical protein
MLHELLIWRRSTYYLHIYNTEALRVINVQKKMTSWKRHIFISYWPTGRRGVSSDGHSLARLRNSGPHTTQRTVCLEQFFLFALQLQGTVRRKVRGVKLYNNWFVSLGWGHSYGFARNQTDIWNPRETFKLSAVHTTQACIIMGWHCKLAENVFSMLQNTAVFVSVCCRRVQ